jgi:ubiquitin-like-conjugating enzyme ATG3
VSIPIHSASFAALCLYIFLSSPPPPCFPSYLPANKQFLAVRNVPCRRRCVRRGAAGDVDDEAEDDGWVASGATDAGLAAERARAGDSSSAGAGAGNAADPSAAAAAPAASAAAAEAAAAAAATPAAASGDDDDNDSIPDMDSMIPDMDALADDAAAMSVAEVAAAASATGDGGGGGGGAAGGEADADAMRWYDITMTWDRFYQTPRLWLHGHDGQRRALGEAELYEDVSGDHAGKTVTRDPHPHTGVPCFSIHPCKHASVMKTFLDRAAANGKDIRPDQAAVVFLKMISCIIPFVEYDNTTSVEM